jgi:Domain of unknown function (DUF3472)/Domain of unknown function (DUF5077)
MKIVFLFTALLLVGLTTPLVQGQSDRDQRHTRIKQQMAEHSKLKYNFFAPSVHIRYDHPSPDQTYLAYYNEIRVEKSVKHTYFCTVGFDVGYFGIQDHGSGHLAIFSVWDKGGGKNDSSAVAKADQTEVIFSNRKAESSRFGGEGSGAKTMMPYPWEIGKTYAFLVALTPLDQGTIYTAWISEKGGEWQKIASYRTVMTQKEIRGFYSFIEDYVRNGETGQAARLAFYPRHGAMTSRGKWQFITDGSGTIADDLLQNGHSGVKNDQFFSQSGADTADYGTQPKDFSVKKPAGQFKIDPLPGDFKP